MIRSTFGQKKESERASSEALRAELDRALNEAQRCVEDIKRMNERIYFLMRSKGDC